MYLAEAQVAVALMAEPCLAVSTVKGFGMWIQLRLQSRWRQAHEPSFL